MGTDQNKKVRISNEMYGKLREKAFKEDRAISAIVDEALEIMFEDVPFRNRFRVDVSKSPGRKALGEL